MAYALKYPQKPAEPPINIIFDEIVGLPMGCNMEDRNKQITNSKQAIWVFELFGKAE